MFIRLLRNSPACFRGQVEAAGTVWDVVDSRGRELIGEGVAVEISEREYKQQRWGYEPAPASAVANTATRSIASPVQALKRDGKPVRPAARARRDERHVRRSRALAALAKALRTSRPSSKANDALRRTAQKATR